MTDRERRLKKARDNGLNGIGGAVIQRMPPEFKLTHLLRTMPPLKRLALLWQVPVQDEDLWTVGKNDTLRSITE